MIKEVCAFSETGLKRNVNQDSILSMYNREAGLFVVADGMGGHFKGELASRLLISEYTDWWKSVENCVCGMEISEIVVELEKLLRMIHEKIKKMYHTYEAQGGTTLCLLFLCKNYYMVMNVGDSRAYFCRKRKCGQITADDIWKEPGKHYGKLTQAVGMRNEVQPHIYTGKLENMESFLLCSDGVYKYCEEKILMRHIKQAVWNKKLEKIAKRIQKCVYQKGAKDNLSLILIQCKSK